MAEWIKRIALLRASITYDPPREAVTGKLNSNGTVNQNPTDGLDHPYMWVRIGGSREETRVKNLVVRDDWANVPVLVARNRRSKELEVVGLDPIKGPATLGQSSATFNTPRRVGDVVDELLPGRNFKPGRPTASGLVVSVSAFPYTDSTGVRKVFPDDAAVDNRTVTITAPGSGLQRWSQIYVNPDSSTPVVGVEYGTSFSLALPDTTNDPQDITLDSSYIPLDAVLVKYGDTTLPELRWRYMRQLVSTSSTGGTGVGGYLVDADGNLIVDANGNLIEGAA